MSRSINRNRGRRVDRRLIKRVGRPTLWESADLCPNLGDDGRHDPYCPDCLSVGGRQYVYTVQETALHMIWMRDKRGNKYDAAGQWEEGSAIAVFPAHHPITDQDRLTPNDEPIVDRLLLTRGDTPGTPDLIRSPHVEEILSIRAGTTTYTNGTDFTLTTNAAGQYQVSWTGQGQEPAVGTRYSVRMMIRPVWLVNGEPKNRGFGPGKSNQLMKTAECVRFDVSISNLDVS